MGGRTLRQLRKTVRRPQSAPQPLRHSRVESGVISPRLLATPLFTSHY